MARMMVAGLLAVALLAGCLTGSDKPAGKDDPVVDAGSAIPGTLYSGPDALPIPAHALFAGPALYADPQNSPHPAFNWPTLANPAIGSLPNKWWAVAPVAALPDRVTGLELVKRADGIPSGAGIAIFGSLVLVPGYGQPTSVVDISDPANPVVLSTFMNQTQVSSHRGAAFIPYPDGRLAVVISTGRGLDLWDLTDPTSPQPLPPIYEDDAGNPVRSHKVGVIPGTPIIVNAASNGGSATEPEASTTATKMWDLSDPGAAVELPDFVNGYGCHHVYFWNNAEEGKFRGICAGIQYTQIWDTADPYKPSVIVNVAFGSGGTPAEDTAGSVRPMNIAHYAGLSLDGTVLLVGDESGGGSSPPGCVARVDIPNVGAVSVPIGAVWFYDVADEANPVYLGHYSASQLDKFQTGSPVPDPMNGNPQRSCTAHHGRLVPAGGRDLLAMSWYNSGVIVVDFTNVRNEQGGLPMTVAQFADNSDTWETWYYNGYLYTGDLVRGMDVLKLV